MRIALGIVRVLLVIGAVAALAVAWTTAARSSRTGVGTRHAIASATPNNPSATASSYRFKKDPIVVYTGAHPDPSHNIIFWVFVRLTRPLPRSGDRGRAILLLDGVRGDGPPFTNSRRRACYSALIAADNAPGPVPALSRPTDGEPVTVTLRFPGRTMAVARVHARHVSARQVGYNQANRRFTKRLGC